jgi:hypothetical protein
MKKYVATSLTVLLLGVVVVVSSSNGQDKNGKKKKEKSPMIITITDTDTIINGKNFRDLTAAEKKAFEKNNSELKLDSKKMHVRMEHDMKRMNADLKKMNSELIVLNDSVLKEFEIDDEEGTVKIYKHKVPRAPKVPGHPELPEFPEFPELPHIKFNFDESGNFAFENDEEEEGMQMFVFNDGTKKTVIKLMKASDKDLKKIGAKKDEEIKLFPNPAKDQLSLNFNFTEASPVTINIYNNDGKLVKSETIKDYKGGNYDKTYNMLDFENGVYLVEFVQKELKIVRKLSVQR